MKAVVLERVRELSLRDIDLPMEVGDHDVKIAIDTVGICGSDVHYYTHGRIGDFVVRAPMVLGHEASGVVVETGAKVATLKKGDRVCMEPGVPNPTSRASRIGMYNVDPEVRFWATPPIHGVLTPYAVHPEAYTFKMPDSVSFAEGALVEPFAIGMQAAVKARITPGDVGAVIGAGPIGTMVALAALAGGCSKVFIADFAKEKLAIAGRYPGIVPVDVSAETLSAAVGRETGGWGADVVFEASGAAKAFDDLFKTARPGGCVVLVGTPDRSRSLQRHGGHRQGVADRDGVPIRERVRSRPCPHRVGQSRSEALDFGHLRLRRRHRGFRAGGVWPSQRRKAADPGGGPLTGPKITRWHR